jgi:hypothetical protein
MPSWRISLIKATPAAMVMSNEEDKDAQACAKNGQAQEGVLHVRGRVHHDERSDGRRVVLLCRPIMEARRALHWSIRDRGRRCRARRRVWRDGPMIYGCRAKAIEEFNTRSNGGLQRA